MKILTKSKKKIFQFEVLLFSLSFNFNYNFLLIHKRIKRSISLRMLKYCIQRKKTVMPNIKICDS